MPLDHLVLVYGLCCLVYPDRLEFPSAISEHYVVYPNRLLRRHQADLLVEWPALAATLFYLTSLGVLEPEHVAQEVEFCEVADWCQETTDEHEDELERLFLRLRQVG
jgi:hypothetical protein